MGFYLKDYGRLYLTVCWQLIKPDANSKKLPHWQLGKAAKAISNFWFFSRRSLRGIEALVIQVGLIRPLLLFISGTITADEPSMGSKIKTVMSVINGISTIMAIYGCLLILQITAVRWNTLFTLIAPRGII